MSTDGIAGGTGYDWNAAQFADQLDDSEFVGQGDPTFGGPAEPISLDPEPEIPDTSPADDPGYVHADASTIGGSPRRQRGAAAYERKLRAIFATGIKITAQRPSTVPDSAALIIYSPKVAKTVGELAASDPRIARGIDVLFDGTNSPWLNAAVALAPLASQMIRNHEPVLEPRSRGLKVPFTRITFNFPFKLGIKLGILRNVTNEPQSFADWVFSQPEVQEAFKRQEVPLAWRGGNRR